MKRCPSCNTPNPDNSKRCFKCRTELTDVEPEVVTQEETPDRKAEFAEIFRSTSRSAADRITELLRHREAILLIVIIIGLIFLLPSVKGGFGLKAAITAGAAVLWLMLSSLEKLVRVLTDIRNIQQASMFRKADNGDREENTEE